MGGNEIFFEQYKLPRRQRTHFHPFSFDFFAAKRINKAPVVAIQPLVQKINLPTNKTIIDASGSEDDATLKDKLAFKWEIVTKPLRCDIY